MAGTLVFIPAWNEESSLPGVLAEAHASLPDVDLLVIDDGSTDGTAAAARAGGADVVSFGENRGLREGIAEGYRQALVRGYEYCGRLDADGQHPAAELARMLELVQSDACDVAIGSRFLPDSGQDGERYKPAPERVIGTSLLRLLMRLRLGQPISDGTSGLYAVNQSALALLADAYVCEAPEVEALVRITDAKLRLIEVPVHMRQREHGESSFRGRRAVELVVTIGLTLFAGELLRRRHQRRQRTGLARPAAVARLIATEPSTSNAVAASCRRRPTWRAGANGHSSGVGAARSPASWRRCDASPPNAAHPCSGPAAAATSAPAPSAVSRLWVRGRVASDVVAPMRSDRAATAWSTSITSAATTAVTRTRSPARGTSGAATAAAIAACCSGSL